jgi:ParB/RepB/Spo0J family partition protein
MAVAFTTEHTRTSEYLFDPKKIIVRPELNGRHEEPDIEPLIADIVKRGQIEPGIVRNDGGNAVLCAGFSRWRAITEINKRKLTPVPLPFRAIYLKANELDGFLANIAENRFRNQTTKLDDAYNVRRLEAWGQTEEQIADTYGEDVKWVRRMQKLVALDPAAQKAVAAGKIKSTAIDAVAKLTTEQQREVVKKAGEGKVKLPKAKKTSKPTEKITTVKREIRHKTLLEIESLLAEQEVWNTATRKKILQLIHDLAVKCEPKQEEAQ